MNNNDMTLLQNGAQMIVLRTLCGQFENRWKVRPVITLACHGGSDEHFQIWHPEDYCDGRMPYCTVDRNGRIEFHPDCDPTGHLVTRP